MFRILFAGLMLFVLGALVFGAAGAVIGLGWLLLAPLLIFMKIALFFLLFGALARMCSHRGSLHGKRPQEWGRPEWWSGRARPSRSPAPSAEDRFDEWHRMAHAREEVDGWVPDLDEGENG